MSNPKNILNLKKQLLERLSELKFEPQQGLEIFIEYDYLLNTDLSWIISEIRSAIIESLELKPKERKRLVLTFRIEQVSTKKCMFLVIILGVVSEFLGNLAYDLVKKGFEKLKEKVKEEKFSKGTRVNIKKIIIKEIVLKEGKIKYTKREIIIEL